LKHAVLDDLECVATGRHFSCWHLATSRPLSVATTADYWEKFHGDTGVRPGDRVEVRAGIGGDVENGKFIVAAIERNRARVTYVSKLERVT
jgi:hypothetical protein